MTKTYMVFPDTQFPYEDRKLVKALVRFAGEYQPDEVVHIGDLMDYPTPSRWTKDSRGEFAESVKDHSEYAKKWFLEPLRAVYDGPIGVLEGNHDLRPREYLARYAPALDMYADDFSFSRLLDFDSFGIKQLPDFYDFAPEWTMTHGHLGKISLSQIAGNTALNAAKKFKVSVIMGHTHRAGKLSFSGGYDGKVTHTVTGVEVGNAMDMRKAHYLKGGAGNWQQAFALVHVNGKSVQVDLIEVNRGRFTVGKESFFV